MLNNILLYSFSYHQLLTPFIFNKVELEYKLREKVLIEEEGNRNLIFVTQSGYEVQMDSCTCPFFCSMKLPCKHIFKLLEISNNNLYVPHLCSERWTKRYFNESHPALSVYDEIHTTEPIFVHSIRIPSEIDKFKKMSNVSKDICNLGASMSTGELQFFMDKITTLRNEMSNTADIENRTEAAVAAITSNGFVSNSIAHSPNQQPSAAVTSNGSTGNSIGHFRNKNSSTQPAYATLATNSTITNDRPKKSSQTENGNNDDPVASTSTATFNAYDNDQRNAKKDTLVMKLPPKLSPVGRPKGSGQTVAGLKRKTNTKSVSGPSAPKKKFLDLTDIEQSLKMMHWLTNKSNKEIKSKKITYSDIIQDGAMFNRLRNDGISLAMLKSYMDKHCYKYITSEIVRLNENEYWACAKCKRNLTGNQLMCNGCLDWFHLSCTEHKTAKNSKKIVYFCVSCTR